MGVLHGRHALLLGCLLRINSDNTTAPDTLLSCHTIVGTDEQVRSPAKWPDSRMLLRG